MNDKKQESTSLLKLLSQDATSDSRALLKKYGHADAKNIDDLKVKLADLYVKHPDKTGIEKEFASIHPHAEFILKYNKPLQITETPESTIIEEKSNCSGCTMSTCPKSSSFAGIGEKKEIQTPINSRNDVTIIIGAITIIGLVGLLLHYRK